MVVLRHALAVAELSDGAYDPTAGALVDLWGFGPHGRPHVPEDDAIAAARQRCGWQRIQARRQRAFISPAVCASTFPRSRRVLRSTRCPLISHALGSPIIWSRSAANSAARGTKPDGSPWWVALESPPLAADNHGSQRARQSSRCTVLRLRPRATVSAISSAKGAGCRTRSIPARATRHPTSSHPSRFSIVAAYMRTRWRQPWRCSGRTKGFAFALDHDVAARFVLRRASKLEIKMTPVMLAMLD